MNRILTKYFWVINLVLLALGACLIAAIINVVVTHQIRELPTTNDIPHSPQNKGSSFVKSKSNRIIVKRNYFESSTVPPKKLELSPEMEAYLRKLEPHLSRHSITQLFEFGKGFIFEHEGSDHLYVHCHIVEGRECHFIEKDKFAFYDGLYDPDINNKAHSAPRELAVKVTDEIGPKHIEHAKNNGVKLSCTRPKNKKQPPTCDIDWGWGEE
jgi:hypothetical protein